MSVPRKPTDDFPPIGWRGLACWWTGQWESARRTKPGGFIRAGERYEARLPDLCAPFPGESWPGEDAPGACPICHGEGQYNEGTGNPSDEGGEEYRTVECFDCDGTGELAVAFERSRARCMDLLDLFNEADASRRRLHRSLKWALATMEPPPLPGFSLASSEKLEQARLDLAYEEKRK